MASFVESATLKVNDQSTAKINKINAALRKLFATAKSMKSAKINLSVNDRGGLQRAATNVRKLSSDLNRLKSKSINLRVNTGNLAAANRQLNRLHAAAARPVGVRGGGRGVPPLPPVSRGRGAPPPPPVSHGRGAPPPPPGGRGGGLVYTAHAASVSLGGLTGAASRAATALGMIGATMVARAGVKAVVGSEDARMRLQQSGFTPAQTDLFMEYARRNQEIYSRIPAADIANASVEQLNAIKANNGTFADYQQAMARIAANAQIMAITFKDPKEGAEGARQLERASQIMGKDVNDADIRKVQEAIMRATIASGGEMKPAESVRALQQLGSSIVKTMSPQALTDLLMVRDEGGRQSTAEWRTTIQELMRGSLNKKDKAAMARHGLRKKDGSADPAIVKEASEDLVGFTENRIVPALKNAGKDLASSAEIATYLDEHMGYTTVAARGIADIVTSLRDGELQRQRAAARAANLDPQLAQYTFRGGADMLSASFATAMARPLDKMGKPFVDAIQPFATSMDQAGKAAEKGDYKGAAAEMTKAAANIMAGPAGDIAVALAGINAAKTLIDPTATPLDRASATLYVGATTLGKAAAAILNHYTKDPAEKVKDLEERERNIPAEIADIEKRRAAEAEKGGRGSERRLSEYDTVLERKRIELENVQDEVRRTRQKVAEEKAKKDEEERARIQKLEQESGLGPADKLQPQTPVTPASIEAARRSFLPKEPVPIEPPKEPIPVEPVKPTTDPLDLDQRIDQSLRRLQAEPKVEPPPAPPPVPVPEPQPETRDIQTRIEDAFSQFPQPIQVEVIKGGEDQDELGGGEGGDRLGGAVPDQIPPMAAELTASSNSIMTAASTLSTSSSSFASVFSTGGQQLAAGGQTAASTISAAAASAGSAYGAAAAAQIRAAVANVNINVNNNGAGGKQSNTGAMSGPT